MQPADAVLKFLAGVGPGSEAEFYLRLFRSRPGASFAAIAVGPGAMERSADAVAVDLRLLSVLELTPVVILGVDAPADAARQAERLGSLLSVEGVRTCVATSPDAILAATAQGVIALCTLTATERDARLHELAALMGALTTHKLIFVRNRGGLRPGGERLSVVNLGTQYDALASHPDLDQEDRQLLEDSRLLTGIDGAPLLIAATTPLNLLHELFTVKGAGTLLRRGAVLTRHEGLDGVDLARLGSLLTSAFGRAPSPGFFRDPPDRCYVEKHHRGAALVRDTPLGGYLTKFAVTREAQGEGIGQDLWAALTADYPRLYWRARTGNPIRTWYEQRCDGRLRQGRWTVYFRGLSPTELAEATEHALSQPDDFSPSGS